MGRVVLKLGPRQLDKLIAGLYYAVEWHHGLADAWKQDPWALSKKGRQPREYYEALKTARLYTTLREKLLKERKAHATQKD